MKHKHSGVSTSRQRKAAERKRRAWLPYGLIVLGALVLVTLFALSFNQADAQTVVPPRVGARLSNFNLSECTARKPWKQILPRSWRNEGE